MLDSRMFILGFVAVVCLVAFVLYECVKHWNKAQVYVLSFFVVLTMILMFIFLPTALGEGEKCVVVVANYCNDTFIVQHADGERDIYDQREDLVAGDVICIDGDDIELVGYDYSHYWAAIVGEEEVASFLYCKDAIIFAEETGIAIRFVENE